MGSAAKYGGSVIIVAAVPVNVALQRAVAGIGSNRRICNSRQANYDLAVAGGALPIACDPRVDRNLAVAALGI
ncbi:hypothetical protein D3C87_2020210 [compost metagenome]